LFESRARPALPPLSIPLYRAKSMQAEYHRARCYREPSFQFLFLGRGETGKVFEAGDLLELIRRL
jgi:hypothetical protein